MGLPILGVDRPYVFPGIEVVNVPLTANFSVTAAYSDVTDSGAGGAVWQIVVPPNSGPGEVYIPRLLTSILTGNGTAAGTSYNLQVQILDELNTQIEENQFKIYSTATAPQSWATGIPLSGDVANSAIQKTYRVQARLSNVGTNSAAGTLNAHGSGLMDPKLKFRRS